MNQQTLFAADIYAALRAVVDVVGKKKAAHALRPEMEIEKAAQWLSDALNPNRRELLPPADLITLLWLGQQAGVHDAMWFICDEANYERARPENPEQQIAELQKDFIRKVDELRAIQEAMERRDTERRGPAQAPRRLPVVAEREAS